MMTKIAVRPFRFLFLFGIAQAQLNLASNGTASQSSTLVYYGDSYHASLAVTGEPTHDWSTKSCSHTAGEETAWWMLTFPSESVFISHVVIYYRSGATSRLAGFSLFITNNATTIPPSDDLCYHHEGHEIPNILQNITCNQMGKYVIIYNERKTGVSYPNSYSDLAVLELCDVQIIGCYKSWWGEGCRQPCPSYCLDNHCYPDNGTCVWGCSSNNCINNDCTNDGICTVGCIKGYAGIRCTKSCYKSWWGDGCRQQCPSYCLDNHCYPDNGTCVWGCNSSNCINNDCTNDGICTVGCVKGYAGTRCTKLVVQCDGVSISLFVSVLVSVIVIALSIICGMWMFYRRQYGALPRRHNNDENTMINQTHEIKAEVNETTYEELGKNASFRSCLEMSQTNVIDNDV